MPELNDLGFEKNQQEENLQENSKESFVDDRGVFSGVEKKVEISKENLQESENLQNNKAIPTKNISPKKNDRAKKSVNIQSIKEMDEDRKVDTLAMIAFEKGIMRSVDMAKKLKDPYVLDALHDKLVGELRDELVKKGKLKNI